MAESLNKKNRALSRWIQNLSPGSWIAVVVIILIGGRYFWIQASQLPPHRQKIVDAFGSAALFYAPPQIDSQGKRFTFIKTTEKGFGLYLGNVITGKKVILH